MNRAWTKPKRIYQWVVMLSQLENLATLPSQALIFLDAELYRVLQVVGPTNMAQPEGLVSYVETMKKGKWNIHHFAFK